MSACFCSDIDYPAVGAFAVCDMHWNSQISSASPARARRDVEGSADLDDLVEALHRFTQAVYRTRQGPATQTTRQQPGPVSRGAGADENRGRLTAW